MRKIIAVDIDEVLASSAQDFVTFSNERWGTNLTIDDYDEHWGKMWGVDHATVMERSDIWHGLNKTTQHGVKQDAQSVLRELASKYELVVITSRRKEIEQETHAWLDMHFKGIFSAVHLSGIWDAAHEGSHAVTKADICKKIGADFLIDDQLKHVIGVAEQGMTGLLFGNYAWNKQDVLPENVHRLGDWPAVLGFFNDISR